MKHRVYLDHNATTPLGPAAARAIEMAMGVLGNPSSLHAEGRAARDIVERSRRQVAQFWGVSPREVVFVSGGSEANRLAILLGWACGQAEPVKANVGVRNEIVAGSLEHPSVEGPLAELAKAGATVRRIPVDGFGRIDLEAAKALLSERTALVTLQLANHEVGNIFPVSALAEAAHGAGALMHTDAVQATGKIAADPKTLGVDLLSLSGHKIGAPAGIGALYVGKRLRLGPESSPVIGLGGGGQERGMRPGTENVLGIAALGAACQALTDSGPAQSMATLGHALRRRIAEISGARFHGDPAHHLPQTLNVRFDGIKGELLLIRLDLAGFAVSNGAACSSGSNRPSPVLLAMGLTPVEAEGALRISLGRETTADEVERFAAALTAAVAALREEPAAG